MCIRAQPFSTYYTNICSDHVIFISTWMPKRVQDLDLRNDADCELLSYGAYVAKGPRYQAAVKEPSRLLKSQDTKPRYTWQY